MKFKEPEKLELKKSTSELKEAVISNAAILNKHHRGKLYLGISNDGTIVGQTVTGKTIRDVSRAISEHIEPRMYPKVNHAQHPLTGFALYKRTICLEVIWKGFYLI